MLGQACRSCLRILSANLIAILILVVTSPNAAAEPVWEKVCVNEKLPQTCKFVLRDNGHPGESDSPGADGEERTGGSGGGNVIPSPTFSLCVWRAFNPPPPAGHALWQGQDPATHTVIWRVCDESTEYAVAQSAAPIPPPDPAVVAQMAISSLSIQDPEPHFGPDSSLAVNRWTYLWVNDPGPQVASATLNGVTVTATATLTSVEWSMGEPAGISRSRQSSSWFECQGAGVNPGAEANANIRRPQEPGTCAYVYQWRSLPERTGGTGSWKVTATSTWTVNWTSNVGAAGSDFLLGQSTTPVEVGEWRSELVLGEPR